MAESVDCSDFCRLCLVKEQVNTPIFEELGDLQQIYIKITACLPIKVSLEDPLPKRICDECSYKLDQQYNFWNTSINAEKQLRQWLGLPEEPPTKSENVSGKIKREKDNYESPSKRPRRNARRKAAQHVRQAAAAAIAASDSGPGEDMDLDAFTKEENDSDNDFHDNNESMEDSTYANVGLDSEEHGEAGPSGLQKGAVTSTNSGTDAGGPGEVTWIKQEPIFEEIQAFDDASFNEQLLLTDIKFEEDQEYIKINNKYSCSLCKKMFVNKGKCKDHYRIHLDLRPFPCAHCDKAFKLKSALTTHLKTHDTTRIKYECLVCSKSYSSLNYARRCEKSHTGIFAYMCTQCEKGFHYKSLLDIHVQIKHNATKQQCHICSKIFSNSINFKNHFRNFHNPNQIINDYKCEQCGKVYHSRKFYKRHLKSHEGFACDICGKIFGYEHGLKNHILIHEGKRPWSCNVCGKTFNKKHILTVHLRTHTNEKPYECKDCGKRFTQRSPLVIHMRYHTGERPYPCRLCNEAFISKNYLRIHMQNTHDCPNM